MPKRCCVTGCKSKANSKSYYRQFYLIPKEPHRRQKWIAAIDRKTFVPLDHPGESVHTVVTKKTPSYASTLPSSSKSSRWQSVPWDPKSRSHYVCSAHFITGKKVNYATHPDWVPSLNMKPAQIDSAIGSVVKKEHIQEASRRSINTLGSNKPFPDDHDYSAPITDNRNMNTNPQPEDRETEHIEAQAPPEQPGSPLRTSEREAMMIELDKLRKERDEAQNLVKLLQGKLHSKIVVFNRKRKKTMPSQALSNGETVIDLKRDEEQCKLLKTLYLFQKKGQLCDLTLVARDGQESVAHAGVLAAACSLMRKELEDCDRGIYTIMTPLTQREILAFIHFAYTGKVMNIPLYRVDIFKKMSLLQSENKMSHIRTVVKLLYEFADKGLFCNTACCRRNGEREPAQSYVLAAKHALLTHIPNDSMTFVHLVVKGKQLQQPNKTSRASKPTSNYRKKYVQSPNQSQSNSRMKIKRRDNEGGKNDNSAQSSRFAVLLRLQNTTAQPQEDLQHSSNENMPSDRAIRQRQYRSKVLSGADAKKFKEKEVDRQRTLRAAIKHEASADPEGPAANRFKRMRVQSQERSRKYRRMKKIREQSTMNKQETGDKKDNRLYNKIKKRESRARLAEKKIIVQNLGEPVKPRFWMEPNTSTTCSLQPSAMFQNVSEPTKPRMEPNTFTPCSLQPSASSATCKTLTYRQKMKQNDPEKYSKFLENQAKRSKERRLKIARMANDNNSDSLVLHEREIAKLRQKKYREKKAKQRSVPMTKQMGVKFQKKIDTDIDCTMQLANDGNYKKEAIRAYQREMKRKSRQKLYSSPQAHRRHKEKENKGRKRKAHLMAENKL